MSDSAPRQPGLLAVITTERRGTGARMPADRPATRAEDLAELQCVLDRACAAVGQSGAAAEMLAKKLAMA